MICPMPSQVVIHKIYHTIKGKDIFSSKQDICLQDCTLRVPHSMYSVHTIHVCGALIFFNSGELRSKGILFQVYSAT